MDVESTEVLDEVDEEDLGGGDELDGGVDVEGGDWVGAVSEHRSIRTHCLDHTSDLD